MIDLFFYLFAGILLGCAFGVILANHAVHAVLLLMASFLNAAALFILLGAEFLGFILIIVYVGAVAVLFLFVVMMLPSSLTKQSFKGHFPFIVAIVSMMGAEIFFLLNQWPILQQTLPPETGLLTTQELGNVLYTQYFLDFQLGGLILLVAIIGAIVLTLIPRSTSKKQKISMQISRQPRDVITVCSMSSGKSS